MSWWKSKKDHNHLSINPILLTVMLISTIIIVFSFVRDLANGSSVNEQTYTAFDEINLSVAAPLDTIAPAVPTGVTALDTRAGGTVELNWDPNDEGDLQGYNLYRTINTEDVFQQVNQLPAGTNSTTDTGLSNGVTYYYKLTAVDNSGNESGFSVAIAVTPSLDATPPAIPTGFDVHDPRTGSKLQLSWNANQETDLGGYRLYRAEAMDGPFLELPSLSEAETTYTDTSVNNDMQYFYKLAAMDDVGNVSPLTEVISAIPTHDTTPPAIPELKVENPGTGTELILSWNASTEPDAAGYILYRSEQADGTFITIAEVKGVQETLYSDQGVQRNKTYWYKMAAYDDALNTSPDAQAVEGTAEDIIPPDIPSGLQGTDTRTGGRVKLTLISNSEADLQGYNLYRKTNTEDVFQQVAQLAAGTNSFTDTELTDGITYYYKLSAVDNAGNESAFSEVITVTPTLDAIPPDMPAGFAVHDPRTGGKLELSWDANQETDLGGYLLYRAEAEEGPFLELTSLSQAETTFTDTTVNNNAQYFYKLAAMDDVGNSSSPTGVISGVPTSDITPPSVPLGLGATDTGSGGTVSLAWAANTEGDLSGYYLYRASNSDGPFQLVKVISVNNTAYRDTGLSDGTTYYYRLSAIDNVGNESAPSGVAAVTPTFDITPPETPAGLAVHDPRTGGLLELNWNSNQESDLAGYLLYRAKGEQGPFQQLSFRTMRTSYNDTGVDNDVQYFYQLAAVDDVGNISLLTEVVSAIPTHDTTPPAIPELKVENPGTGTELILSWNASTESDAAGYTLYRSEQAEGTFITIAEIKSVQETVYADVSVARNNTYWYKIAAYDDMGNTSISKALEAAALDVIPPAIPQGLNIDDPLSGSELQINWQANLEEDLAGYNLYRSNTLQGTYKKINKGLLLGTSYMDTKLDQGQMYYYKLTAEDTTGNETEATEQIGAKPYQGAALSTYNPDGRVPYRLHIELSNSALFINTSKSHVVIKTVAEDVYGQPVEVSGTWKYATDFGTVSNLSVSSANAAEGELKSSRTGTAEIIVEFIPDQQDSIPVKATATVRALEWYVKLEVLRNSAATGSEVDLRAMVIDGNGDPVTDPEAQVVFRVGHSNKVPRAEKEKPKAGRYQADGKAFPVNPFSIQVGVGRPDAQGRVQGRLVTSTVPGINRVTAILQFRDLRAPGAQLQQVDSSKTKKVRVEAGPASYIGWNPGEISVELDKAYQARIDAYDSFGNITEDVGNLQVSIQSPAGGDVDFSLDRGKTWLNDDQWYEVPLGEMVKFRLPVNHSNTWQNNYGFLMVRIDSGSRFLVPPPGINQVNKPLYIKVK